MSSHVDVVEDARPNSHLIGMAPHAIMTISKILVSVPQPEIAGTRLKTESIYSAIYGSLITLPGKNFDNPADRWIDVTGSENREYRILFLNGSPIEIYIRTDANTVIRFGLRKKKTTKL